ncbi:MAG: hypothetical protein IPJ81_06035 [Chitinophagaceae bacterium]|nr:hypothetical protein [Chitinophagaceae bacterium]
MSKILQWVGVLACIALIISCFMPWAYYADINETFTGVYSYKNEYGKPGKYMIVIGVLAILFILLPRLWAKRVNMFLCGLLVGYSIKTYVMYTSCYNAYCPQKLPWIYVMLTATVFMLLAAIFTDFKIKKKI